MLPDKTDSTWQRNPLVWALPLQALLLLSNLDLLDPWGDEWFTLTTVPGTVERSRIYRRRKYPSAALFCAAALLDLTPVDNKPAS